MKSLRFIFNMMMLVISFCLYNPIVVDSADFTNIRREGVSPNGCKGPFGFDSQKISKKAYKIGIVSSINLEKNPDGTWYIASFKPSNKYVPVHFAPPYPQQNDLKEGDFIGYTATRQRAGYFSDKIIDGSGKILENISTQSAKCKIDDIPQLSTPYFEEQEYSPRLISSSFKERPVTGVVMALTIKRNPDPEPEYPSDYLIRDVVMKCADGNLYLVDLGSFRGKEYPSHGAFGEGDVITVTQKFPVRGSSTFSARWGDSDVTGIDTSSKPLDETKPEVLAKTNRNVEASLVSYPVENFKGDTSYPVVNIIDGNTVTIDYNGWLREYRLIGVKISRVGYGAAQDMVDFADGAHKFTKNLLLGETVYLRSDPNVKDSSGNGKQMVYLYRAPDGLFVNLEIIRQGYGHASLTKFKFKELFRHYETKAFEDRKGAYEQVKKTQ